MKSNKTYRFKDNPQEKIFHDKFLQEFERGNGLHRLSGIVFGWEDSAQRWPKSYLTEREADICINLIQWLGSPVGQSFLEECGFELKKNDLRRKN